MLRKKVLNILKPFRLFIILLPGLCFSFNPLVIAQKWEPVPIVSQENIDAGAGIGGEGGQVICVFKISPQSDYMLMGTNTGGIFRREFSGERWMPWEPCNDGFDSRGGGDFTIDPGNPSRVIGLGVSAGARDDHGLYLSTDKGKTWHSTIRRKMEGNVKGKLVLAYDPSSFDKDLGYCTTAYWVFYGTSDDADDGDAIYRSQDGGETWNLLTSDLGYKGFIRVLSSTGDVFYAGSEGLFKSDPGGEDFKLIEEGNFTGLDIPFKSDSVIFACTETHIYRSNDRGITFSSFQPSGIETPEMSNIRVSPLNYNHIILSHHYRSEWWGWHRATSTDGGKTLVETDNSSTYLDLDASFFRASTREGTYLWSLQNELTVWSVAGDGIYRSDDSGKYFHYDNEGNNGVMLGRTFNFNSHRPDSIFLCFQDKNTAWTANGGDTWRYIDWTGLGHGNNYGGIMTDKVWVTGNSDSWGGDRNLSWKIGNGDVQISNNIINETQVAYVDPVDESVVFMGEYRSDDDGASWKKMADCDAVFIHNYDPAGDHALYGLRENSIVQSTDKGNSWSIVKNFPVEIIRDLAYDFKNDLFYFVTGEELFVYDPMNDYLKNITERLSADQFGAKTPSSVAIDPVDPNIVYVAQKGGAYCNDNAISRSKNAGKNWEVLTRASRHHNEQFGKDGGRMPQWIRVHPATQYLYVGGGCYGIWKIGPPPGGSIPLSDTTGVPEIPENITAVGQDRSVSLNWNENREADLAGYNIYRSLLAEGEYQKKNTSAVLTSEYEDSNLENGREYYYKITALDNDGNESDFSEAVKAVPRDLTPPDAPQNLEAIDIKSTSFMLIWSAVFDLSGIDHYKVFKDNWFYSSVKDTFIQVTGLTEGMTYNFFVYAVDSSNNISENSDTLSVSLITSIELKPSREIIVYPNPSQKDVDIKIKGNSLKNSLISVYNPKGDLILSTEITDPEIRLSRDKFAESGLYIVKISSPDYHITHKLLIQ